MNIIKFKDMVRLNDRKFNELLKGKYAYFVAMRYAIPFDHLSTGDYVSVEQDISNLQGLIKKGVYVFDILMDDHASYVDEERTELANSNAQYVRDNKYTTDSEMTLEEIKQFRKWLAVSLLELDTKPSGEQRNCMFSEQFTKVLQYYADNLYNDVVKALSEMPTSIPTKFQSPSMQSCGCNAKLTTVFDPTIHCDPLNEYRKFIHSLMVNKFDDIEFWMMCPIQFLAEFKQYIDNIIRLNLPLAISGWEEKYSDCYSMENTLQMTHMDALKKLSKSLQYMIEDDMVGHRNFITDAFRYWADKLYELMYWN